MPQFIAIEPEYIWKVESLDDGSKLLSIATDNGPDVRIAWDAVNANKLSKKMASVEPASAGADKGIAGT